MMELKQEILEKLSSKGILAYVAVSLAGNAEATTASLAGLVRAQTTVMLDGLKELAVAAPETVRQGKKRWLCGKVDGQVQNLDCTDRYREMVDDLKKYWDYLNPGWAFAMNGKEGIAIRRFLSDYPSWTRDQWVHCLRNRIISIKNYAAVSRSEPVFRWVGDLPKFAAGPLNAYGRPAEGSGKHGDAVTLEERNRAAKQAYLAGTAAH